MFELRKQFREEVKQWYELRRNYRSRKASHLIRVKVGQRRVSDINGAVFKKIFYGE